MKLREKVILTTFSLFMVEAIMHYNLGRKECKKEKLKKGWLPSNKSLIRLAVIVGVFSVVNGVVIKSIK